MKTYRELLFTGSKLELQKFLETLNKSISGKWIIEKADTDRYFWVDYVGTDVEKARVSIFLGEDLERGEIRVGNIIPLEKSSLTIDEYNLILEKFYREIVTPLKDNISIEITYLSNDEFDPLTVITGEALKKLEKFCSMANKSTGSSHPCDQERWFDFICQTVDDGKMFDSITLGNFLQDKTYWGEKEKSFIGVIGNFAWDPEIAYELAQEYEQACEVLKYYKTTRGV